MFFKSVFYVFAAASLLVITNLPRRQAIEITPERPEITYWNPVYLDYLNITARRTGRNDAVVINLYAITKDAWGSNMTVDVIFFEYLSNAYKRSFIELHENVCKFIRKDQFVGRLIYNAGMKDFTCPYPAKKYSFENMKIVGADLPPSFPFTKGRVNITVTQNERREVAAAGIMYITVTDSPSVMPRRRARDKILF